MLGAGRAASAGRLPEIVPVADDHELLTSARDGDIDAVGDVQEAVAVVLAHEEEDEVGFVALEFIDRGGFDPEIRSVEPAVVVILSQFFLEEGEDAALLAGLKAEAGDFPARLCSTIQGRGAFRPGGELHQGVMDLFEFAIDL